MEISPALFLIAQSTELISPGVFQILFWSFLVAALIWLLVWMFLRNAGSEPDSVSTVSSVQDEADEPLPEIATVTPEQAADAYQTELDDGSVRQDEILSILYNKEPDGIDDLKKISGVAKVLEKRLHESDVYRFKQIAYWTESAAKEFSKLLKGFKDRIYREDWISQAKQLHEEKYGERL